MILMFRWPWLCRIGLHEWVTGCEFIGPEGDEELTFDEFYHCSICDKQRK